MIPKAIIVPAFKGKPVKSGPVSSDSPPLGSNHPDRNDASTEAARIIAKAKDKTRRTSRHPMKRTK